MDRFFRIAKQALQAVLAFKLRAFFCLISVSLGIASICIIVAATEGAYKRAYDIVERFGPDSLLVLGGSWEARAMGRRPRNLKLADVAAVEEAFPSIRLLVPFSGVGDITVSYRGNVTRPRVTGSTQDYCRSRRWSILQGSDISEDDVKRMRNVGVIGQDIVQDLFGTEDPVGKYILVGRLPVRVIGVLADLGASSGGHSLNDQIVMPLSTVMRKLLNETTYIRGFWARFQDPTEIKAREKELTRFLRVRLRATEDEADPMRIISPTSIVRFLVALTGSLVLFIGIVGVICLIVAGFVLANLFLISVKERTKEIGIRRALGAKRRDIWIQLIGEAVLITATGGVVGFVLALLGSELLTYVAEFPIYFSWKAFAVGMVLSTLVGVVFGLHPAALAARLEPTEAIRA